MVTVSVAVQLLSSVTVTVYVPIGSDPMSCVVDDPASFQLYIYGAVPPATERSIDPSEPPLQLTFT